MKKYFKMLACAGGGFFCLWQIILLEALEAKAGKPCWQIFRYLAGTSGGAINTGALALGVSASNVHGFWLKWGKLIFTKDYADVAADIGADPRYSNENLIAGLRSLYLVDDGHGGMRDAVLADCKVPWTCTMLNASTGKAEIVCSWRKSEDVAGFGKIIGYDDPREIWQLVLASTAAPTYFPGVEAAGSDILIDGGMTGANAPDDLMCFLAQDKALDITAGDPLRMLSLGGGNAPWPFTQRDMAMPSVVTVLKFVTGTFLDCDVDISNLKASLKMREDYFHLCPLFDPTFNMADTETGLEQIPPAALTLIKTNPATLEEFCSADA